MTIRRTFRVILSGAGILTLAFLAGCANKVNRAVDQAKSQATTTNTPQQVQYVDSDGNTITKTVQPPAAQGQQAAVSTLTTPPPPGPKPHSTDPVITPLTSGAQSAPMQGQDAQPMAMTGAPTAPQPSQPGQPPSVSVQVPAGTELAIRIDQRISVKTSQAGDHFNGNVVEPVSTNGTVVIPNGTPVSGRVVEAHHGGHFRGRSVLELRLTAMTLNGYEYPLDTHDSVRSQKGKGRRSAGIIGGMTGAGMLIGGLATGGVGLTIGAAAGAGGGTAIAGATGNHNLDIPAESIVHFRLADPLIVQNP
jgi:outer membrane murein-binding lipoprotein Lpp